MIYFLPCSVLYYTRCAIVPLKMVPLSQPASFSLDLPTVYMAVIGVLGEILCFGEHSLCLAQNLGSALENEYLKCQYRLIPPILG